MFLDRRDGFCVVVVIRRAVQTGLAGDDRQEYPAIVPSAGGGDNFRDGNIDPTPGSRKRKGLERFEGVSSLLDV
jgi:hypothetical protein